MKHQPFVCDASFNCRFVTKGEKKEEKYKKEFSTKESQKCRKLFSFFKKMFLASICQLWQPCWNTECPTFTPGSCCVHPGEGTFSLSFCDTWFLAWSKMDLLCSAPTDFRYFRLSQHQKSSVITRLRFMALSNSSLASHPSSWHMERGQHLGML